MLTEVRMATLGVSDLDAAIRFYTGALQYKVLERGQVAAELAPLWRFDASLRGSYAVLGADDSGLGRLRLLHFDPPGERIRTPENKYTGAGFTILNFRCRDARDIMDAIVAAGGTASKAPSFWEVSDQVHVWDSISADPDGIQIDMFSYEKGGELRGPLDTEVSVLQTIAITTPDVDRSADFYKGLGFQTLFDRVLDFPELQDLLGTEEPVKIRNANLLKDGSIIPGRVEMFAYLSDAPPESVSLRDKAVPPNVGLLSISMVSDDLTADRDLMLRLGAEPVAQAQVDLPGFGRADVAVVLGPDGEAIEIIRPITA